MAIRLICRTGTLMIQSGPTEGRVEIASQARDTLRRILGPDAAIRMRGRNYYVHIDRDRVAGLFTDVLEKYGS